MSEYRLDGEDLDDPQGRWHVMEGTTLPTWGAPRLPNVEVPGRNGLLPLPPTTTSPITVKINIEVNDTHQHTRRGRSQLDQNLHALAVRVRRLGGLMELVHAPAGVPARVAQVRLSGDVQPLFHPRESLADLTLLLEAPQGVWRDLQERTLAASDLSGLDGGVLPVGDALVLVESVTGPVTVTDQVSGTSMRFTGAPRSARSLLLDPARYQASWTQGTWAGGEDVSAHLSISSGGFALTPDAAGRCSLSVAGGVARVRARRAY